MKKMRPARIEVATRSLRGKGAVLLVVIVIITGVVTSAGAEWELGISVNEGASVLGGPLVYRLANPEGVVEEGDVNVTPDAVTSASVDAITSASRVAHGGGLLFQLRRGGSGALVWGIGYNHYRFDLDYTFGRASMDIVTLRIPLMARLVVARLRDEPFFHLGFGGYLEITLLDKAELSGEQKRIDVEPLGFGILLEFYLTPYHFDLGQDHGRLSPGLFLRAYRGVITQLRDEEGTAAPLVSATLGISLIYEM